MRKLVLQEVFLKISNRADGGSNATTPKGTLTEAFAGDRRNTCSGQCAISGGFYDRMPTHGSAIANRLRTGADARAHQSGFADRTIQQHACASPDTGSNQTTFDDLVGLIHTTTVIVVVMTGMPVMAVMPFRFRSRERRKANYGENSEQQYADTALGKHGSNSFLTAWMLGIVAIRLNR